VRAPLSVVILAKNERDRLPGALDSVAFADEVVVADTGSTDGTLDVARLAGARVVSIGWEGFVGSRNRALLEARHDWVLVLDADERVTPDLKDEIFAALEKDDPALAAYRMPRLSHFLGRPVRHGTWYPDYKLRLGRRSRGLRAEGGRVHETLAVDGTVGRLASPLVHHPYRDLSDALRKASRYAQLGAEDRFDRGSRGSASGLFGRPAFEFFRFLVLKRGFLDGAVGWSVAFLHASSYFLRAAYLLELQRRRGPDWNQEH
jgi:glycosyltransferase involved in cell wall biosynthesis